MGKAFASFLPGAEEDTLLMMMVGLEACVGVVTLTKTIGEVVEKFELVRG